MCIPSTSYQCALRTLLVAVLLISWGESTFAEDGEKAEPKAKPAWWGVERISVGRMHGDNGYTKLKGVSTFPIDADGNGDHGGGCSAGTVRQNLHTKITKDVAKIRIEEENGDIGRKTVIEIEISAKGNIQLDITQQDLHGEKKKTTESFKAENAEELKKKHPKAFRVYQEFQPREPGSDPRDIPDIELEIPDDVL